MPITPALQMVTWCLLFSSLTTLWVAGLLSPLLAAAGYSAIGVSAVRVRLGSRPWLSAGTWHWLTLGVLLLFLFEWLVLGFGLLMASLHLLLYLMFYKLLTLTGSRDYLHLYLVGFFQLLASTTAAAQLPYGAIFFCYVVLAPWTLMLYTLQVEAEQQFAVLDAGGTAGGAGGYLPVIRWPFFVMTTGTAIGTFVLTLGIFFILPRGLSGAGFVQTGGAAEPVKVVGFSDRVDLGTIGAVKLDPTVVMRVSLSSDGILPRHAYYWRGTAYDYYDGSSWNNRLMARRTVPRSSDGQFRLVPPDAARVSTAAPLRQEIVLEPIETAVIFAAADPVTVAGRLPALRVDGQSTLLLPAVPASRLRYEVDSVPPRLLEADHQATLADYPAIPPPFLQLPAGSGRLVELARQVAGLSASEAPPVLEQARRIERYLRENYRYTLEVEPPKRLSAIDDFLFEQKAGYCEYYATAMVLMLRGLGIPARMVSGFLEGEWNDFGNYFTVRQQDAHTWVEVYFPRTGWFPFDPTPSVGDGHVAGLGRVRQLIDTLWVAWDRYILRYSIRDQAAVLREMWAQSAALQVQSLHWMDRAKEGGVAAVEWLMRRREVALLLAAAACFAFLVMRWWAQRHGGWPIWCGRSLRTAQRRGRSFYARLLRLLAARGVEKPPAMTALEFLQLARPRLGAASDAAAVLTDYYHRLRFGAGLLTVDEQAEVGRLLRQVEREVEAPRVRRWGINAPRPSGGPSPDRPATAPRATRRPPSPD